MSVVHIDDNNNDSERNNKHSKAGDRLSLYQNSNQGSSSGDIPLFTTIREDKTGGVFGLTRETENEKYDRLTPESGPYADTNGDPNAELISSTLYLPGSKQTITKRPDNDIRYY